MAVSMGKSCVVVAVVLVMISPWPLAAAAEGLQHDQSPLNFHDRNYSSSCIIKSPARPVNVQPRDSNFLCRTLGRCLLQSSSSDGPAAAAQAPDAMLPTLPTDPDASSLLAPPPDPGQVAAGDPPPSTSLPTLPTDPEPAPASSDSSPPSPADPSSTATSNSSPPSPVIVGDPNSGSTSKSSSSNIDAKIGVSAGVGVTGVIMVIVGLLYYFKPDVFMCCRTCVRVQIFHHNPHAVGKINHSTV